MEYRRPSLCKKLMSHICDVVWGRGNIRLKVKVKAFMSSASILQSTQQKANEVSVIVYLFIYAVLE